MESKSTEPTETLEENFCRICLRRTYDIDNQFIKICKCTGSTGVIHLNCMKAWLETKRNNPLKKKCRVYEWSTFKCDVCGTSLPCIFLSK